MPTDGNKQILIVEDSQDIQFLLSQLLRQEGYTVEMAANGREAIERLNSSQDIPGLILLDLMMPVMDGYEFRREQQRDPRTAGIPVVVMTADGGIEAKANTIGAKGFLKKPFADIDKILETVERFFDE